MLKKKNHKLIFKKVNTQEMARLTPENKKFLTILGKQGGLINT